MQCAEITIRRCNNGFIVKAGCATFVINTTLELLSHLQEYYNNPQKKVADLERLGYITDQLAPTPQYAGVEAREDRTERIKA